MSKRVSLMQVKLIRKTIVVSIILFLFIGCSTIKYIPVDRVKTEYISRADTTIIKDSVFIDRWKKADTVYLTKEKFKYIYKVKTDTLHRVDTITKIRTVEVPVEYIPEIYKRSFTFSIIIILGFVILLALKLYKIWKK